eukprot:5594462-Amphidinium_carterae.2
MANNQAKPIEVNHLETLTSIGTGTTIRMATQWLRVGDHARGGTPKGFNTEWLGDEEGAEGEHPIQIAT